MKGIENIQYPGGGLLPKVNLNATTPNFLFRDTKRLIQAGPAKGKILKENGSANNDFLDGKSYGLYNDATPGK